MRGVRVSIAGYVERGGEIGRMEGGGGGWKRLSSPNPNGHGHRVNV